ncbi:hypothetical protein PR001_g16138 [Phytophthora rubi]|uniref:Secreted protein n=1 Tax=Phytophthora rubi TaxID=129364 RepID=A0A6A3KUA2_9STRA|nr:hypothetical protein PR001_g16138 [Phytophthora rubi]
MCLQLGPSLARYLLVTRVVTGVVCDASAGISASRGFATPPSKQTFVRRDLSTTRACTEHLASSCHAWC